MLKAILGVVVGAIVAVVGVGALEMLGHMAFPPPPGLDLTDPEQLRTAMEQISFEAKAAVVAAWFLGAFAGAGVAILVADRRAWPGWIVATLVLSFGVMTMIQIPHPVWMMVAGVALPVLAGWMAARIWSRPAARN